MSFGCNKNDRSIGVTFSFSSFVLVLLFFAMYNGLKNLDRKYGGFVSQ
jgi:hypothetical protein